MLQRDCSVATIRVVVAHRSDVVLHGLEAAVGQWPRARVAGTATSARAAADLAARRGAHVVLLDASISPLGALGAASMVAQTSPRARLVLLVHHLTEELLRAGRALGVAGYVAKSPSARTVVRALEAVTDGEEHIDPALRERLASGADRVVLSEREVEILRLAAEGLNNPAIAQRLAISEETVKTHVKRLLVKLGAGCRTHAVTIAFRAGIIE
jgi:DNA-binding NarL/FixJ family response regulator